jgi:DMSO/TMAO reductase YedYZ molybdopterin-dependent catalytic subunit
VIQKLGHFSIMSSFIGGLGAGAIAISVSLLLRIFFGGLFIPELASQTLFSLTPGQVESQAVETLGPLAKYSAFIGAVIANLILYGLIGLLLDALHKMNKGKNSRLKRYAGNAIQYSLAAYIILVLAGILLLALTETNLQAKLDSIRLLAVYLVPPSIAFGFILSSFYEKILSSPSPRKSTMHPEEKKEASVTSKDDVDYKKRILLRAGIASAVALPILYYGLDSLLLPKKTLQQPSAYLSLLKSRPPPSGFEDPRIRPLLDSEITPTELFYRIDKNPVVPVVNAQDWKLTVKGLVDKPLEINYKELRDMPSVEQFATLECVSNKIGGDLISTAIWKGIRLRVLLDKVHMMADVKYIVFRCFDGYDVGIPLERGLLEGTILAYDMNGAALTAEHGYPLRAIVPGIYGMMNAKWLTEIELVDKVYEGYWQRKGWTNVANYNTHSVIIIPGNSLARKRFSNLQASNVILNQRVPIAGIAFAGDRGISKVEVSSDGGNSWKIARIKDPLSQYTWVLWTVDLDLSAQSNRSIIVRATDKTGKIQADEVTDPFPDGATGYDMINV